MPGVVEHSLPALINILEDSAYMRELMKYSGYQAATTENYLRISLLPGTAETGCADDILREIRNRCSIAPGLLAAISSYLDIDDRAISVASYQCEAHSSATFPQNVSNERYCCQKKVMLGLTTADCCFTWHTLPMSPSAAQCKSQVETFRQFTSRRRSWLR